MLSLLSPRLWCAVFLAAVLAFTHFVAYRAGSASMRAKWDAATVQQLRAAGEAERENRRLETLRQSKVIEAQNAATKRTQALQTIAAAARAESDGLRDDLARNTANLPSAALDACREYAATANAILGDMAAAGGGMAEKAGGHASDALMLEQAWPR